MKDMLHIVLSDLKWWAILFICSIIGPSLIILLGIIIGEIIYYIGYNVILEIYINAMHHYHMDKTILLRTQ